MKKQYYWRPAIAGENWMQTLFRMLGNLVQWVLTTFLLFYLLIAALQSIPSEEERYKSKVNVQLNFFDRPDSPSWKYEKIDDSNFTNEKLISEILARDISFRIRSPQADKDCNNIAPLLVTLKNTGQKTVAKVDFFLEARKQGRSTDILSSSDRYRTLDFVIAPGETVQRCLPVSASVLNGLNWEAKITHIVIQ